MKTFGKLEALALVAVAVLVVIGSALTVMKEDHGRNMDRGITPDDSQVPPTIPGAIVNSLGHTYAVTFDNLQRATWACNATDGGWVQVPPCTLSFPSSYKPISNFVLRGAGASFTTFTLASGANAHMVDIEGKDNVTITNIHFDVNGPAQNSSENLSAIYQHRFCRHLRVANCSFTRGHGSYLFDDWYTPSCNTTVEFCDFHRRESRYWHGAISFAGADCIAKKNVIQDTQATGIRIHGSRYYTPHPRRCLVMDNVITGEVGHAIHMEYASDCTIINNTVVDLNTSVYKGYDHANAYSSGILITTGTLCQGNILSGLNYRAIASAGDNVIIDNVITDVDDVAGIIGAEGDVIANNTITCSRYPNRPSYGIKVVGSATISDNTMSCRGPARFDTGIFSSAGSCTIVRNRISTCRIGIRADHHYNSLISHNTIHDADYIAVLLFASSLCNITSNSLDHCRTGVRLIQSLNCLASDNGERS